MKISELSELEVELSDIDNAVRSARDELEKSEERCNALEKLVQGLALIRDGVKDVKASCQEMSEQNRINSSDKKKVRHCKI